MCLCDQRHLLICMSAAIIYKMAAETGQFGDWKKMDAIEGECVRIEGCQACCESLAHALLYYPMARLPLDVLGISWLLDRLRTHQRCEGKEIRVTVANTIIS